MTGLASGLMTTAHELGAAISVAVLRPAPGATHGCISVSCKMPEAAGLLVTPLLGLFTEAAR